MKKQLNLATGYWLLATPEPIPLSIAMRRALYEKKQMSTEKYIKELAKYLRAEGFKKRKATWRRESDGSCQVVNVQKSQWDSKDFYTNIGIFFKELGDDSCPDASHCHMQQRIDISKPEIASAEIISWFSLRDDLEKIKKLNVFGELEGKGMVMAVLKNEIDV